MSLLRPMSSTDLWMLHPIYHPLGSEKGTVWSMVTPVPTNFRDSVATKTRLEQFQERKCALLS